MRYYWLLLGVLCVWRITHLLQAEDGPWELLARFRQRLGAGFWGSLLDCFYCLSLWIAIPFAVFLGEDWIERGLLWPALSAGAILLERVTNSAGRIPAAHFVEEKEAQDVMLRQTEGREPRPPATGPEA
jgi:hypothetical protein